MSVAIIGSVEAAVRANIADSSEQQKMARGDLWHPRYAPTEIKGQATEVDFHPILVAKCNRDCKKCYRYGTACPRLAD